MTRHFVNLTNGLEWCAELPPDFAFVRIESTAIEHEDWTRILRDLDVHFLMCLALGEECHLYDCGMRRAVSKTVSIGVPYIVQALTDLWILRRPMEARTRALQELKTKLRYVGRYLATDTIRLTGHSRSTVHDGDRAFYGRLAQAAQARDRGPLRDTAQRQGD